MPLTPNTTFWKVLHGEWRPDIDRGGGEVGRLVDLEEVEGQPWWRHLGSPQPNNAGFCSTRDPHKIKVSWKDLASKTGVGDVGSSWWNVLKAASPFNKKMNTWKHTIAHTHIIYTLAINSVCEVSFESNSNFKLEAENKPWGQYFVGENEVSVVAHLSVD